MTAFDLPKLIAEQKDLGRPFFEFLRVPALSMGLYTIHAGATDPQKPHAEDEVYLVLEGRGCFQVGEEDRSIGAGTLLFVPARMPHRFHSITEDLNLLVFFAPAESADT